MIDPTKILMDVPTYNTDKVIGIIEGTTTVAAPTALEQVVGAESMHDTGFGEACLTACIFSLDGGVTYNDNDMTIPDLSVPGSPVFQTCDVTSFSRNGQVGIAVANWYNLVSGSGTVRNIIYKIYCLAKYNQGSLNPIPTNEAIYFRSTDNYLKIQPNSDTAYNFNPLPIGSQSVIYAHDLGYVPNSRAYIEYVTSNEIWPVSRNNYPATAFASTRNPVTGDVQLDETTLTVNVSDTSFSGTLNINVMSRVYLDD